MYKFDIDDNQGQVPGAEIINKVIYVNKEFIEDFEKAVSEDKWFHTTAITSTMFGDCSSVVSVRVKELRKEKEKQSVVKYYMDCDLAKSSTGMCSIFNVYFLIVKDYMEECF